MSEEQVLPQIADEVVEMHFLEIVDSFAKADHLTKQALIRLYGKDTESSLYNWAKCRAESAALRASLAQSEAERVRLRQVVKKYRGSSLNHSLCGKALMCGICVAADEGEEK